MAFRPIAQQTSQIADQNTFLKHATTLDGKTKPETLSNNESSKENMSSPVIAAVEGGFHTQFVLFTRNDVTASAAAKAAFLLKVHSNCCWDSIRTRILEMIARCCPDNTVYPPVQQLHIDGFLVEILPKADTPEMLPPDAQKKLMSRTLHAICIRITVDHLVVSPPVCTSLATGLSAFTKLELKLPSEKSCRNVELSQSRAEHVVLQSSFSHSFEPCKNKPVKRLSSPLTSTAAFTDFSAAAAKPSSSVRSKPAILQSSSARSTDSSTKFRLMTNSVDDSKLPLSSKTESVAQPVPLVITPVSEPSASADCNTQYAVTSHLDSDENSAVLQSSSSDVVPPPTLVLPLSSLSSVLGSVPSTDSSDSQKRPNIVPIKGSVKLSRSAKDTDASSQRLTPVSGSLFSIRQDLREAAADIVVVDEDKSSVDELSVTDSGASVQNNSLPSSTTLSQSPVSHSSSVAAPPDVDGCSKSMSLLQSVSDIPAVSQAVTPLAGVDESDLSVVPVTSVNTSCLQLAGFEDSLMMETAVDSSCTSVMVEQVTRQNGKQTDNTELIRTGSDDCTYGTSQVDTETAGLDEDEQTVANTTDASCIICDEELSDDAENYSVAQQKQLDQQYDDVIRSHLPWASAFANKILSKAAAIDSQLSLLLVDSHQSKPVESRVPSSVSLNDHQRSCSADLPDTSSLDDDVIEIVPSDEVHTIAGNSSDSWRTDNFCPLKLHFTTSEL